MAARTARHLKNEQLRARAAAIAALCIVLCAIPTPAVAQQEHQGHAGNSIEGVLIGRAYSEDGRPLSGAIVRLFHLSGAGQHLMSTSVTDSTGRFTLRSRAGTYTLDILYPGHEPHHRQVTLDTAPLNLGAVRLQLAPLGLDTLRVRGERAAVELRSGVTIVNTRASAAAGGSIADVLRTVPGLDLDADGRISMRGSTSVLVLMNGRRIPLTGDALVAFLRQMPATAVDRIEAGTTASARQDADGVAGVVNLVFRDGAAQRSSTRSVAASMATDDHYMASAAATGNVRNVLNWDATYSLSGMRPRTNSTIMLWSLVPGDLPLETEQDSRAREKHRLHSVLAGAAVTPTPNTSLALRGMYSWMEGAYRSRSAFLYTNAAGNTGTSATSSRLEHEIPSAELSAVAGMNRGRVRFTSEARTSVVNEDFRGDYYDERGGYRYMNTAMASGRREHGLRSDVEMRFSSINLDAGHQSHFRTISASHDATHFDAILSQVYRHETDVHAGYLSVHGSTARARVEVGVRVEAERTRVQLDSVSARNDVRMFPSLNAEWTDARSAFLYRLAYGRRINRPGAEMLNPFAMGDDDMNEIIGNPSLLPEVSDQMEFGIERRGSNLSVQLTPYLRWTRDPIRQIKSATARGGTTTTLENLNLTRAAGADASVRGRVSERTVVTLAGGVAHINTTGDVFRSSGIYATARLTVDLRVATSTTAQIYAYRRSAHTIEQGEILPAFTSDVTLTQRLAGDRGRVMLRISDPLRSDRLQFRIADADFTQESSRRTVRPLLSLFASYSVGGAPREDAPARPEGPAQIF